MGKKIGIIGSNDTLKRYMDLIGTAGGDPHSFKLLTSTYNNSEYRSLWQSEDFKRLSEKIFDQAYLLKKAGADCIVIANARYDMLQSMDLNVDLWKEVEVISGIKTVAQYFIESGVKKPGLIGTNTKIYNNRLMELAKLHDIVTPDEEYVENIKSIIAGGTKKILEPGNGHIIDDTIKDVVGKGADAVLLNCVLLGQKAKGNNGRQNDKFPRYEYYVTGLGLSKGADLYDTAKLQVMAAIEFVCSNTL